jgi:hypothetical protein
MSIIAEKIKQKLEAFEQYYLEEPEENNSFISESEEEPKTELETINTERIKRNSTKLKEPKEEFINKYLNEKNIGLSANSHSCKDFQKENNHIKNNFLFLEKDFNYKINEYVSNKLNKQNLSLNSKNPEKKSQINNPNLLNLNNINNKNNLNYQMNYSTDHSQNIDSNAKQSNFNYIELGYSCENTFDYFNEEINNLSSENKSILISLKQEEKIGLNASGSAESKIEKQKSNIFDENINFTLRKITSLGKDSNEKTESEKFDEIELHERESFFYKKFEDDNFNENKNEESEKNFEAFKVNKNSLWRKFFLPSFYFIEEFIFVFLMVILLILDPIILIFLKFVDFIYTKINNHCIKKNYSKVDDVFINNNNHLLFCCAIEEIDTKNIGNFYENRIYNVTLCEKYFNYFFNNCAYKKQRNIIKVSFIVIALLINLYILMNFQEKKTKLLLFFLNNLYLLYHTMDLFNEKLLNYTENIGWNKIINKI